MMKREDWFPSEYLKGGALEVRKVKVNVGGQLFELSEVLIRREPGSLLAALMEEDSPLAGGEEGVVHVDRDWWTFRHVMKFLRDGVLPRDKELLTLMYKEASFWRMRNLKRAIEEERLELKRRVMTWDEREGEIIEEEVKDKKWYKDLPNWWESAENREKRKKGEKSEKKKDKKGGGGGSDDKKEKDWWTGANYNGRKYSSQSKSKKKGTAESDDDDDKVQQLSTTWSTSGGGRGSRGGYGGGGGGGGGAVYGNYSYPGVTA